MSPFSARRAARESQEATGNGEPNSEIALLPVATPNRERATMTTNNAPEKKKPTGGYAIGYAKPPKSGQFPPGQSGQINARRPKGRPSPSELFLEEIARIVRVKIGDEFVPIDKERAIYRKLIDSSIMGNMAAARPSGDRFARACPRPFGHCSRYLEAPLTPEELAVMKMMTKKSSGG